MTTDIRFQPNPSRTALNGSVLYEVDMTDGYASGVSVIDWLLDGDPSIRWQALNDLVSAPADDVAAERACVEHEGWGARLLAAAGPDGL